MPELDAATLAQQAVLLGLATQEEAYEAMNAAEDGSFDALANALLRKGSMTRWQVDRKVVLPQALRFVAPSLVVQLVSLLKDTSLGYIVAFTELLYRGQVLSSFNGLLIQTFVVVTVIFLALNGGLSGLAARLQKRPGRRSLATPTEVAPAGLTTPNAPVDR